MTSPLEAISSSEESSSEIRPKARHIILLIGDGMGEAQARAASLYGFGEPGRLSFEELPYRALVRTDTADGAVTDSAAAATAMATGQKVSYNVVSLAIPGDGAALETILEILKEAGWATGIATTAYLSHSTPAGFMAHVKSRFEYDAIGAQIIGDTRPTVLFGGSKYISQEEASLAGYDVVRDRHEMLALSASARRPVFGGFSPELMPYELDGLGHAPHLSEMTKTALDLLSQDEEGFFLMVEGALIDFACHDTDLERAVWETLAFSQAVAVALDFAEAHLDDTLLIVVADHETGGLEIVRDNGKHHYPEVLWRSAGSSGWAGHTGAPVPYFGLGVGAEPGAAVIENTDIHRIMMNAAFGTY
jgi:alkaline phosphatase